MALLASPDVGVRRRTLLRTARLAFDWTDLHACAACRAGSSRHSFSVGGSPRAKADQSHARSQDRRTPCALLWRGSELNFVTNFLSTAYDFYKFAHHSL